MNKEYHKPESTLIDVPLDYVLCLSNESLSSHETFNSLTDYEW